MRCQRELLPVLASYNNSISCSSLTQSHDNAIEGGQSSITELASPCPHLRVCASVPRLTNLFLVIFSPSLHRQNFGYNHLYFASSHYLAKLKYHSIATSSLFFLRALESYLSHESRRIVSHTIFYRGFKVVQQRNDHLGMCCWHSLTLIC